jgi:prolyl-tRNA synthetase
MDVIGLPWQLIVGPRGWQKGVVELNARATGRARGTVEERAGKADERMILSPLRTP